MDKKEFIITLGDQQGLRFSQERAEKMIEKGGVLDMVQLIRTIIFQSDVTGCRPHDDLQFDPEEGVS
jgi:hypothetical protein